MAVPTAKALRNSPHVRQQVFERCSLQSWRGVDVKLQCGPRGRGLVASRSFIKGEIVADYHAKVSLKHIIFFGFML